MSGKVIVIAGAGGIGNALARRYAAEGAKLVIGDRNAKIAMAIADEISGDVISMQFDGTDEASAKALVAKACEAFGGLDGMHVNFASFADAHFDAGLDIPIEAFDEVMRVNTRGYFICAKAAVPALVARGGGSLILTSSAGAYMAETVRIGYAMSKAAVNALVRAIAKRHGPDGVRANAIAPGIIPHEFQPVGPDALKDWAFGVMALKTRLGSPADIAAMGALLMSDEGALITGQILNVDGGIIMRA